MTIIADEKVQLANGVATTVMPRVNLLPPEFAAKRELRRTQIGVVALSAVAMAVVAAAGAVLFIVNASIEANANKAEAQVMAVRGEISKYSDVPRYFNAVDAAKQAQTAALRDEVLWYQYLNDIALSYPKAVWLNNLTFSNAAPGAGNPLATQGLGSVSVSGGGYEYSDVASWMETLDRTAGFTDSSFANSLRTSTNEKLHVDFQSSATVTFDARSGRYTGKDQP